MNIKKKSTTILEHQKADIDIPYELSRQKISFWLPKDESADIVERMPKIMIKFRYPIINPIEVIFSSVVLKESKYKIVRNNSTTCNGKNYYLRSCDGPN
jgi:hypothetical protein